MNQPEYASSIFQYYPPKQGFIGILSIPHSGENLPSEFESFLSTKTQDIMQDVDYRVHELVDIEALQGAGIAVIKANIIRTAIDLNRPKESALLNWKKNSKGIEIVRKTPDDTTAKLLLEKYYSPYFEMLNTLILELEMKMKHPSFIDLHSMPAKAEEYHLKINPNQNINRPDFCLSDISGISCEEDFLKRIGKELNSTYSEVNFNDPYFGGHITRALNDKYDKLNNIQIEISRGIYMDESNKTLNQQQIDVLRACLTTAIRNHFEFFYNRYRLSQS